MTQDKLISTIHIVYEYKMLKECLQDLKALAILQQTYTEQMYNRDLSILKACGLNALDADNKEYYQEFKLVLNN